MKNFEKCMICESVVEYQRDACKLGGMSHYYCGICGKYCVTDFFANEFKHIKTLSYLYYRNHGKECISNENNMILLGEESQLLILQKDRNSIHYHLVTKSDINNWMPISFIDKINKILMLLSSLSDYEGDIIKLKSDELRALFFLNEGVKPSYWKSNNQLSFAINYLEEEKLAKVHDEGLKLGFQLTAKAYKIVYDLYKEKEISKTVFVAISFSDSMKKVKGVIKETISNCGYIPVLIDEKEHNNQIMPEIFYEIKRSAFVIADLTENKNGVYYEAGYAEGLGKIVIHTCKKESFDDVAHFDVKQKSTVLWNNLNDLKAKLEYRIKATVK